jgi:enoyl-CoA hydratase
VYDCFVRIGNLLLVPRIAAVRGASVGAGVNQMLVADVLIVSSQTRIISGFLRLGIHPGRDHCTLLGRLIGREATSSTDLFGEEFSGERVPSDGVRRARGRGRRASGPHHRPPGSPGARSGWTGRRLAAEPTGATDGFAARGCPGGTS